MALTCARCGAQNPDGNAFCQACGTPLRAAAVAVAAPPPGQPPAAAPPGVVAGPPPGLAPPMQTMGGGYQSPYYVPAVPSAPVHRTPWTLIVSAVVGLVIVMAGCGTAVALLGSRGVVSFSGGITGLPSPTPGGSPSPIVTPTAPVTGPTTLSNVGLSLTVPTGWTVVSKDAQSITLGDPNGNGALTIASGPSTPALNAQQNKDQVDQYFKQHYPDTKPCPNTSTPRGPVNGAKGLVCTLC